MTDVRCARSALRLTSEDGAIIEVIAERHDDGFRRVRLRIRTKEGVMAEALLPNVSVRILATRLRNGIRGAMRGDPFYRPNEDADA